MLWQSENTITSFLLPNRISGGGAADSPSPCSGAIPSLRAPPKVLFLLSARPLCSLFFPIPHSAFLPFLSVSYSPRVTPADRRELTPEDEQRKRAVDSHPFSLRAGLVVRVAGVFLATSLGAGSRGPADRAIRREVQEKPRRVRPKVAGRPLTSRARARPRPGYVLRSRRVRARPRPGYVFCSRRVRAHARVPATSSVLPESSGSWRRPSGPSGAVVRADGSDMKSPGFTRQHNREHENLTFFCSLVSLSVK